ncbi:peptidylprolyl isomerase [Uliginosibacterium sp. H1]|uniref:peptidylprolyl isomerase n=1 Tax=Uliginosibacterium sp. H1 TaxID=3114757 RepID=UPI002E19DC7E|nr:peptidylprolyl isomerase [Uliginosibacterium sp. H1]
MNYRLSSLAAALLIAAAPAFAQTKPAATGTNGTTIAKVNGQAIPASLGELLIKEQAAQGANPNDPQLKTQVREHLIRREVLLQEARKRGFDKDAAVRQRMDYVRDEMLVNTFMEDWAKKNPVSEAQAKAEYDKVAAQAGDTEYQGRHILVATEAEAQAAIKKLQAGAKFEALAKEISIDPGSKDNGGELGWARGSAYVPEFSAALGKLEKGKFTPQAVKTQFGYHIILLEDTRKAQNPSFDELKPRIMQGMQQQALQKYVTDLVSKSKVE